MMTKRSIHTTLGGLVLIITTLACSFLGSSESSTPELPNYGIFLIQGNSFVELKQYSGKPSNSAIQSELETASPTPVFWVWYPQMNQQYFMLVNLERTGTGIPYKITPKDTKKQILEIKPNDSLSNGEYCFVQGDPLGSPFSTPYWCFKIGDNSASQPPTESVTSQDSTQENPTASQNAILQEWTIKTGDIQYIGVASDGTIYGVGPNLYAIISKDGNVFQTNEVNLSNCLRSNFTGGSGDISIDRWFVIKPDSTILAGSCIITFGNPPTIKTFNQGPSHPYADEFKETEVPRAPNGFSAFPPGYNNPFIFNSSRGTNDIFVNFETNTIAFADRNVNLKYFELPDEVGLQKNFLKIQFVITPWDYVYYSYPIFDSLGNELEKKFAKVEADGSSRLIDGFPYIGKPSNSITVELRRLNPVYLPERNELYFYQHGSLSVYDLDFNYLREYPLPLPPEFPAPDERNKLFVGHDGAMYTFNVGTDTLTKYSLLSNSTSQLELNQEAITFRDQALQTLKSIKTIEYSIADNSQATGHGMTTANALHEIYYNKNGDVVFEFINTANVTCNKIDATWTCSPDDHSYSLFAAIENVLNGVPTVYHPLDGKIINSGSKLETHNGQECRSFIVASSLVKNNEEIQVSDEFCFDLLTHLPVYWVTTHANLTNGVITDQNITKASDFEFNNPVEIILPQP